MLMFAPLKMQAQMAELVDASDSKSGIGNNVQVRFLFWAQGRASQRSLWFVLFCFYFIPCPVTGSINTR